MEIDDFRSPSAWRLFLHPVRGRDEIIRLHCDLVETRSALETTDGSMRELERVNEALQGEIRALTGEKEELSGQLAKMERSVAELGAVLIKTRRELDESRQVEKEIQELAEYADRVEEMKKRYEARISGLKESLRESRRALRRMTDDDSGELSIDMEQQAPERPVPQSPPAAPRAPRVTGAASDNGNESGGGEPESDWLSMLPDF